MKRIILFVVLLALVAGGAFVGYTRFHKAPDAEAAETAKAEEPKAADPVFVQMHPFVLPVIGDRGPEQVVQMIVTLEVPDNSKAALVKTYLPRLNDAYMQALYGALDRKTVTNGSLIDVNLVKEKLFLATTRVMGDKVVDNVLVQAVSQRRL